MNRPQWITSLIALFLVFVLYFFGKTVPDKKNPSTVSSGNPTTISIDSILVQAKKRLLPEQLIRLNELENSISRGDVKAQQLKVYHQLSHFWADTARLFEPYAWYEAQAARLENSEKSLTFAAHLLLENLRGEDDPVLKNWKASEAKDLFDRALKINPDNDSSRVGRGASYIFGNIGNNPMTGIQEIRQVLEKDSTNVFAQMMLGHGSLISGQYEKAIDRFRAVVRIQPSNIEAILLLAEVYERQEMKEEAVEWYERSLPLIRNSSLRFEVEKRIKELKK